jgi:hypothetical protein
MDASKDPLIEIGRVLRKHVDGATLGQIADSDGSRPGFRDDLARHSDLMSLAVPR